MAEPLSALGAAGSVVGVLDVTVRASAKLVRLCSEIRRAPDLVLALSNEVADLAVVLQRAADAEEALGAQSGALVSKFRSSLRGLLDNADIALKTLDGLSQRVSAGTKASQRIDWFRHKSEIILLKDELQDVREKINGVIISSNLALSSRVQSDLEEIKVTIPQGHIQSHRQLDAIAIIAESAKIATERSHCELLPMVQQIHSSAATQGLAMASIENQFSQIITLMEALRLQAANSRPVPAVPSSPLHAPSLPPSDTLLPESPLPAFTQTRRASNSPISQRWMAANGGFSGTPRPVAEPLLQFGFSLGGSRCPLPCPCRCHTTTTPHSGPWKMPAALRSILGHSLVGYTAQPAARIPCDVGSCLRERRRRFQVFYTFPWWFAFPRSFRVLAETSGFGSVRVGLYAIRRVGFDADLQIAMRRGDVEMIRRFLNYRPDLVRSVQVDNGWSLLHYCLHLSVNRRTEDIVKALLFAGADINHSDDEGRSTYMLAAHTILAEDLSRTEWFWGEGGRLLGIEEGINDLGLTFIHKVVTGLISASLESVLDDADPGLLAQLFTPDLFGYTPLWYAARRGDEQAVRALIQAGAPVHVPDSLPGRSPIVAAARCSRPGSAACLRAVLSAVPRLTSTGGMGPNSQSTLHFALTHAAKAGNAAGIEVLINAGVDPNDGLYCNWCPLHSSAINSTFVRGTATVEALVGGGADLNAKIDSGQTPLIVAAIFSNAGYLYFLAHLGADYAIAANGETVLHAAALYGDAATMDVISTWDLSRFGISEGDPGGNSLRRQFNRRSPETTGELETAAFERMYRAVVEASASKRADGSDQDHEWYTTSDDGESGREVEGENDSDDGEDDGEDNEDTGGNEISEEGEDGEDDNFEDAVEVLGDGISA